MCGICGIVGSRRPRSEVERAVTVMRESIRHRGPDDAGSYVEDGIALGVQRLAVLDLSLQGHMPMWSADGRCCMVYNGEIYNFRELRADLERSGVRFRSQGDSEVLVELYARDGAAMLPRLNGMFAFAVWDAERHALFIARDRLGVKPLYYALHEGAFMFASEQKALFAAGVPKAFDDETWEELLCFRFTAGERTPLRGVKRLPAGHSLCWDNARLTTTRWWSLAKRAAERRDKNGVSDQWFADTFDDAVAIRRISDVPVGVLLSGGLDSSAVAASLAMQMQERTETFTVRFSEKKYDEGAIAREVAARWNLNSHELIAPPDNLFAHLRAASVLRDEPLAHVNELHLLLISMVARPRVTVLLSGEGADETLGGYVRYQPLRFLPELRAASDAISQLALLPLGRRIRKMARFLQLATPDDFVIYNACDALPAELRTLGMEPTDSFAARRLLLEEAKTLYDNEPARQAMYMDQHAFLGSLLDRNDRMTMGACIECRTPFLDYRLVEALAAVPSGRLFGRFRGKAMLRRTMGNRLPASVLSHRKWGFGVPWNRHLREVPELRQFVGMLPSLEPVRSGPFARKRVRALVDAFLRGDEASDALIFQLAMIAIWHDAYLRA